METGADHRAGDETDFLIAQPEDVFKSDQAVGKLIAGDDRQGRLWKGSWATTLTSFDSTDDITASMVLQYMCAAAEILRYESGSGWSSTHTSNFESLLSKVFPAVYNGTQLVATDGNQGAMCVQGLMAYVIYENNTTYYNMAVACYEGTTSSIDPCVAVTYYIDSNGSSGESGRDQAHSQGGLISYASICEMANCQGLDLWGYASNRLLLGFEYVASYNLGNTVSWTNHGTCNTHYSALSTINRGFLRAPFEAAYDAYVVKRFVGSLHCPSCSHPAS